MRIELCGVNTLIDATGGKFKKFCHIVSSDCSITNIFLIANKPFPHISKNTTLPLSATALPLSVAITIFKSSATS